jgi:hypothetical protein
MLTTPAVVLAAGVVALAAGVVALVAGVAALLVAGGVEDAVLAGELELELLEHAATVRLSATAATSPTGRRYRTLDLSYHR